MNKFTTLVGIVSLITVLLVVYVLGINKLLTGMEYQTLDWRIKFAYEKSRITSGDIVVIQADDETFRLLSQFPDKRLESWPWPSEELAKVIERISRDKPRSILLFPIVQKKQLMTSEEKEGLDKLALVAKNTPNLIIADKLTFNKDDLLNQIKNKTMSEKEGIIDYYFGTTANPEEVDIINKYTYDYKTNTASKKLLENISYSKLVEIPEVLLNNAHKLGIVNLPIAEDGNIRYILPLYRYKKLNAFMPSAFLQSLFPDKHKGIHEIERNTITIGKFKLNVNDKGQYYINWKRPNSNNIISLFKVYIGLKQEELAVRILKKQPINYTKEQYQVLHSLAKSFFIPSGTFKDKIVVISRDRSISTPINNYSSSSGVFMNILDSLLYDNKGIYHVNILIPLFLVLAYIAILGFLTKNLSSGLSISLIILLSIIGYITIATLLYQKYLIWIDIVLPVLLMSVMFVGIYSQRYRQTWQKLEDTYQLAIIDGLTGLYNHRYFQEKIRSELQKASRRDDNLSLLLIDVDHFKKLNDLYGHRAGDSILIEVGKVIKQNVRNTDIVARYGGEEICVIVDKSTETDAVNVAEKIRKAIEIYNFSIPQIKERVQVTISIGVASYPEHAKNVEDLFEFADRGLYRAKNTGRNQVGALSDPGDSDIESDSATILNAAKNSFERAYHDLVVAAENAEVDPEEIIKDVIKKKVINPSS